MAPRQVIPYDEGGGRASRQLFVETHHQQQQRRHQQQQQRQQPWADPAAALENEPPSSCFAPQAIVRREDIGRRQDQQLHSSDLRDALGDEDDEDEDGDESVELGAPTHWAGRDLAPKPPGVEIFVGGLTRSTRRDMLRDWFQHAGEVTEVRIARDKRRRRCRGYGYVRFSTSDEANRAIDTMHRFEFKHGRFLGVLPSDENRTLFVGGLKEEWSCAYICQLLKEKMPGLRKVEPIPDREDPFKIRTFCFLEFASHAEAAAIFDRHQTSPKPAPRAPSAAAPPTQQAFPPLHGPGAAGGVDLRAHPTARAGGAGAGIDNGGELFFERDARDGSSSTGDTSGGDFFASTAAAAAAAAGGAASSPDLDGGDPSDGPFRFEASSLGSVWGQRHLCLDSEDRGDGDRGGGGGLSASDGGFLSWGDTPAAPTATTAAISADDGGDPGTGDPEGGGNGGGAGATTTVVVPLVVGGATLKVDWADPLRYHIHLNGGIKGPSAPPEFGMPDGRLPSRGGGGGGGCGRTVSGNAGCGRAGSGVGGGGGVSRGGGGFGVARSWQQQQHQEQHQGLSRHPSASSARWQDADYAGQAVQQQQQQQQHRLQQQRHPQHQRQCMDACTAYGRAASSPATTTRDRRYTVAGDVTTAPLLRRAPFCEDGTDRQRAASSSSSSGGLPPPPRRQPQQQHRHASRNHHRQHHHHSMLEFAPPPYLEMAADREDSGEDYRRSAFPSSWESSEGCLGSAPPPPPPHREVAAVSGPAVSRLRPHQQRPLRADGGVSVGGGVEGGRGSFERRHSYHHHLSHEPGAARSAPSSGRPFSASPVDRSDGLGALSGGGGGGGGDDAPFSLLRSASCRPITGERRQQQQSAGPSSLSVSSWDGRASLGEESAAGGTRMSSCNGAVGWLGGNRGAGGAGAGAPRTAQMDERYRSSSWVSGAAPAFDGHQALQQKQQQRWDHLEGIVHDRETEDLAVKDHGWAFGHANTGSSGSSGNSGRDPAGFGMGHRDFAAQEQQQQQQQQKQHRSERFSSAFAASAPASAATIPDVRRGGSLSDGMPTVGSAHLQNGDGARVGGAGGLVFGQTAARGHSISGDGFNPPPPGFAAAAAAGSAFDGGGGVGGDDAGDGWIDTRVMSGRSGTPHDRQQQQQQQRERGGGGGGGVDAVGSVADSRIDTSGLWESVSSGAARGNGRSERQSSWPSALLPPDSGAGAGLPASWGL